jgi:hypothetical protein
MAEAYSGFFKLLFIGGNIGEDISERLGPFEKLGPKATGDGSFPKKPNS